MNLSVNHGTDYYLNNENQRDAQVKACKLCEAKRQQSWELSVPVSLFVAGNLM